MKLKQLLIFIFCCGFFFPQLQATHFMGAEITYECLGTCNYRIYQRFYLDCSGASSQMYMPVSAGNAYPAIGLTFSPVTPTAIGSVMLMSWSEVTPVCPGFIPTTGCNNASSTTIPGVVEAIYAQDYSFCNITASSVTVELSNCCRNYTITSGQSGNSMYVWTTINLVNNACNNSPYFLQPPTTYICASSTSIYQGAQDPDGDSLSYSLGTCLQSLSQNVTYSVGYSPTQPLGPTWQVAINPTTGIITFSPIPGNVQIANMCIVVSEWRKINGIYSQIGQTIRDIQVTVLNCSNVNDVPHAAAATTSTSGISNLSGGTFTNGTIPNIQINPNAMLDFDFTIEDADAAGATPTQSLEMSWIQNISGLTFSNAANASQINTITGASGLTAHINWQAPASGSYLLIIKSNDNYCPLLAQYAQAIRLNVGCTYIPSVSVNITNCTNAHLDITPSTCMTAPFSYQWTGILPTASPNGGFDCTLSGVGNHNYSVTVTDANGLTGSYSGIMNVAAAPVANAGNDFSLCPGSTGVLGAIGQANNTYLWTSNPTATGFASANNIAQPTVSMNTQANQITTVAYTLTVTNPTGCTSTDVANVTFINTPNSSFAIDTTTTDSCLLLTFTGVQYPNAFYHWIANGSVIMSGTGAGPYTVCYDSAGTYDIGLWVRVLNTCNSDTTFQSYSFPPTANFKISNTYAAINSPLNINYQGFAKANSVFTWNFDGGTVISGSGAGPYQVSWANVGTKNVTLTLTTPDFPTDSYTQSVAIVATGVEKPFSLADISLSPNPASQILNVQFIPPFGESSHIELLNANGQKLQQWNFGQTKEVKLQAEVGNLPKGIYFMLIRVGDKTFSQKWVKA